MAATMKALEVLAKGMRLEEDGRKFYLKAAEETIDPKGKEMFLSLADDERSHYEVIKRQYDSLMKEGKWVVVPEEHNIEPVDLDKPLFPPGKEGLKGVVPPEASEMDALLFALEIENDSYNLYRQAALEADDPVAREMYIYLSNAERTHFDLLMANWEYLAPV